MKIDCILPWTSCFLCCGFSEAVVNVVGHCRTPLHTNALASGLMGEFTPRAQPWSIRDGCRQRGEGNGTLLKYSCLENPRDRGNLVGCSPWGPEESDMTEWFHFHFSLSCIGEGNGNLLHCSCLENSREGRAWWAAVYGVAQRWTQLKRQQQQQPDNFVFLSSLSWVAWDGFHDYLEGSTRMNWHSSGQCICGRLKNDTPKIIMFLSWNL